MPDDFGFINKYGSAGTGNDNFNNPFGMDTDGEFLYIADATNHRILKKRLSGGTFIAQAGITGTSGTGTNKNDLNQPRDILLFNDRLFVVDTSNNRIKIYDKNFNQIKIFGSSGTGNDNFSQPTCIITDGRFLYICDSGNSRIVKYDAEKLTFDSKAGTNGSGNSQLVAPEQISYNRHEDMIYIVDFSNTRVVKWKADDLSFVKKLTTSNSTDSSLTGLSGITIKNHFIYLLESNRIQVFDTNTFTSQTTVGTSGTGNTNISDGGYIINHNNTIIFSDLGNDRINVWYDYNPERSFVSKGTRVISGRQFQQPSISFDEKQLGVDLTIGGTEDTNLWQWKEEDAQEEGDSAWVKEV